MSSKKIFVKLLFIVIASSVVVLSTYLYFLTQPFSEVQANQVFTLNVYPNNIVADFKKDMRSFAIAPWEHSWGRPYLGDVQGIRPILQEISPGIIRYSGGLWVDGVAFTGGPQRRPVDQASLIQNEVRAKYPNDNNEYYWNYGTDEMAALDALAKDIGADVMVQVNIVMYNPQMWADMVRYVKDNNLTSFKYWEFGNELDLSRWEGKNVPNPNEYANRVLAYQQAMRAVDPDIITIGGVPAFPVTPDWIDNSYDGKTISRYITTTYNVANQQNQPLNGYSYHWYQEYNTNSLEKVRRYAFYNQNGQPIDPLVWNNSYSRRWGDLLPNRIRSQVFNNNSNILLGLSEINVDSAHSGSYVNSNHIGAVWLADALGRLAYNGVDFAMIWMGYNNGPFGMIRHNDGNNLQLQSSYYTYYMYNKYFGDKMVQTTTSDKEKISIWASRDSKDPNKIKLMVINFETSPLTANINLNGTIATTGQVYTLTSTQTITQNSDVQSQNFRSRINGVEITPNNVSNPGIAPTNITINNSSFNYTVQPFSVTSFVLNTEVDSSQNGNDTTPDSFNIQNLTNQPINTNVTTNAITITGINTTVNATTTLGTIVKNGTNTNQTSTTVVNGDNLAIRLTTSPNYSTTLNGTLTVGTVSDNFSVTTIECFEDVQSASIPFHKTICNLKKNGVIHGYLIDGKRYYKSSNHVTRGEMAKFIKNGANIPTNTTCQSFPDVQPDAPFYEEITSLKCANIVQGYPVGNGIRHYRLSNNVTRGEMAAFIYRAFKIQTNTSCQNFPDVGPNDQFYTEITSLKCASIIQGYLGNDGKRYYRPSNHVTRGEMSVFIDNARN